MAKGKKEVDGLNASSNVGIISDKEDDNDKNKVENLANEINQKNNTGDQSSNPIDGVNIKDINESNTTNDKNESFFIQKNKENFHKKTVVVAERVLDRASADWLCDNCNGHNFARLLSGVLRTKCFKCMVAKSGSCVLVLSVAEVSV
jgi:hypothetical protein